MSTGYVKTVSATYQAVPEDAHLLADDTTASFTITLPQGAMANGLEIVIEKKVNTANVVTISPKTGDVFESQTTGTISTITLNNQYEKVVLRSDGKATATWYVVTNTGTTRGDFREFAAAKHWSSFSSGAASVLTRLAGGNEAWVQAASVTVQYSLNVGQFIPYRTTTGKGFQLNSFDLVYLPITASLTSIAPTLYQTTYANNAAAVIVSTGAGMAITAGTNTLTVPSTGPWLFTQTVTTPAFFNPAGDVVYLLEVVIVTPATAVPNFYGAYLNYTTN